MHAARSRQWCSTRRRADRLGRPVGVPDPPFRTTRPSRSSWQRCACQRGTPVTTPRLPFTDGVAEPSARHPDQATLIHATVRVLDHIRRQPARVGTGPRRKPGLHLLPRHPPALQGGILAGTIIVTLPMLATTSPTTSCPARRGPACNLIDEAYSTTGQGRKMASCVLILMALLIARCGTTSAARPVRRRGDEPRLDRSARHRPARHRRGTSQALVALECISYRHATMGQRTGGVSEFANV
jgi:hypothetical protein